MDSVARGTLVNLATRIAALAGVLLPDAVDDRGFGMQQGAFALFTSLEGVLLALLSGFGVALARRVSHHGEQPRALLSAMLLCCAGIGLLAAGVLWAVSVWGPPAYASLWLLALGAPVLLLAPNAVGWWLGEGRMSPIARLTLAPPWLALAALGLLWSLQFTGLVPVLAAWVGAKVVVGLVLLWVLWRSRRLAAPGWAALREQLPFVATIGVTNLIGLLNYRVGLFVVERVMGLSATGVYSIAVVAAELLWFVSSSLTQAAYSRIGTPDRATAAATTVRVVQLSVVALLIAAPLLWLVARTLVPWLLGPAYAPSVALLAVLLPGVLLFGGASALAAYFTHHAGAPEVPARVAAMSLLLNGSLALVLVPLWGMAGAALAASLSYAASVGVLAWLFVRHAGLPLAALLLPGPHLGRDIQAVASRARRS